MQILNCQLYFIQEECHFVKLLKENIINRFEGLLELVPQLGKAVSQLFKGDFSGAAETAANAVSKVTLGVDNITDQTRRLFGSPFD